MNGRAKQMTRYECAERITHLQEKLRQQGLDGALISHPIDLYYFTGTRQNGVLWASTSGESQLMVRKSFRRAREEALIDQVLPFPSSKEFATSLPGNSGRIGMTFDVLPVQQYNYFAKLLPNSTFADISAVNRDLRSVKSAQELAVMRMGGEKLCGVFAQVPDFLRAGMREVDLAAEFEMRLRKAGGEGYVRMRAYNQELFQGLAVSGDHGCTPGFFDGAVTGEGMSKASPHGASEKTINRNEAILIDYTGVFDGYILDMTRMFVIGKLSLDLQQAFTTALAIQATIKTALLPGAVCSEIFELAERMAAEAGLGDRFMGGPGEQAKFVGHGVGLELDEMPVLAKGFNLPLQENQTIAVEPKFVFPGTGVVGIENTFVVSKDGGKTLTTLSDQLVEL
jgi:Xaa-Pro aminopeptidase